MSSSMNMMWLVDVRFIIILNAESCQSILVRIL